MDQTTVTTIYRGSVGVPELNLRELLMLAKFKDIYKRNIEFIQLCLTFLQRGGSALLIYLDE